MVIRES